jgi:hypothetical protein
MILYLSENNRDWFISQKKIITNPSSIKNGTSTKIFLNVYPYVDALFGVIDILFVPITSELLLVVILFTYLYHHLATYYTRYRQT